MIGWSSPVTAKPGSIRPHDITRPQIVHSSPSEGAPQMEFHHAVEAASHGIALVMNALECSFT